MLLYLLWEISKKIVQWISYVKFIKGLIKWHLHLKIIIRFWNILTQMSEWNRPEQNEMDNEDDPLHARNDIN